MLGRRRGHLLSRRPEIDPAREQRPRIRPHLLRARAELVEETIEPARPQGPLRCDDVLRDARPLVGHLVRHFEVELHAVGALSDPEGLVRIRGRRREQRGAFGELERVAVPLERRAGPGEAREDRVVAGRIRREDRQDADLRDAAGGDARAEARREELHAEACAEERRAGVDRIGDQALLSDEPGMLPLVGRAHRAAHRDDRVDAVEPGQRVTLVEFDAKDRGAALEEDILVDPWRLAGDVLKNEDSWPGHRAA